MTQAWNSGMSYKSNFLKCDELALVLLKIEILLPSSALRQNLDKEINSNVNKEFLPKNSSMKIPNKFPKKSKENPKIWKKIQTISQKILRFWKYPIPYIALRARKSFRACLMFVIPRKISCIVIHPRMEIPLIHDNFCMRQEKCLTQSFLIC